MKGWTKNQLEPFHIYPLNFNISSCINIIQKGKKTSTRPIALTSSCINFIQKGKKIWMHYKLKFWNL